MITTTFYFPAEEVSMYGEKCVISTGHDLNVSFLLTLAVIFICQRLNFIEITLRHGWFSCKFAADFQNTFS